MFTSINQCLINTLAIVMAFSGFVYSELCLFNGLWLFRAQSMGLRACDAYFDRVDCRIENRALDWKPQLCLFHQVCDLAQMTSSLPEGQVLQIE